MKTIKQGYTTIEIVKEKEPKYKKKVRRTWLEEELDIKDKAIRDYLHGQSLKSV